MEIIRTERLIIREMEADEDAAFICELLNAPKFLKYIGDRGVRTIEDARAFIDTRYRQSYLDHGYGLYTVLLSDNMTKVGVCGFVKRDFLDHPDIGFSFLPEHEAKGYGFESASALLSVGRYRFGFDHVLAITTEDNDASGRLLTKLGFAYAGLTDVNDETLRLFSLDLSA